MKWITEPIVCKIHSSIHQIIKAKVIFQNPGGNMPFSTAGTSHWTEKCITQEYSSFRGCMKSPLRKPDTKTNLMVRSRKERKHWAPGLAWTSMAACTVANTLVHKFQKERSGTYMGFTHHALWSRAHCPPEWSEASALDNRGSMCTWSKLLSARFEFLCILI